MASGSLAALICRVLPMRTEPQGPQNQVSSVGRYGESRAFDPGGLQCTLQATSHISQRPFRSSKFKRSSFDPWALSSVPLPAPMEGCQGIYMQGPPFDIKDASLGCLGRSFPDVMTARRCQHDDRIEHPSPVSRGPPGMARSANAVFPQAAAVVQQRLPNAALEQAFPSLPRLTERFII